MLENSHKWQFFRIGGFDQVLIEKCDDLANLENLDKKLWAVLSIPVDGIEFEPRTLEFIDSDSDRHIRAPEIIDALNWCKSVLNDLTPLENEVDFVELSSINRDFEGGARIYETIKNILETLDKSDSATITLKDAVSSEALLNSKPFNGDGVITAESADGETAEWIKEIIAAKSGVVDRNGELGVNIETVEAFSSELATYLCWLNSAPKSELKIENISCFSSLVSKIDDFFIRCSMAQFDGRASSILNFNEVNLVKIADQNIAEAIDEISSFPISQVSENASLHLFKGVNPAWREPLCKFAEEIIFPVFGNIEEITFSDWNKLKEKMQSGLNWWNNRPAVMFEHIDPKRALEFESEDIKRKIIELIEKDLALKPVYDSIVEVEKLLYFCRDIKHFSNNFITLLKFYRGETKAVFQSGTLFLDGRSFDLCIKVTDINKHSILANLSRVFLIYCECVRDFGKEKMNIVAAVTDGDADQILVGRNGLFYDRNGKDWDATIVKIIEHPISIRQAFWYPYKRIGKMVGEQLQKIAAAKSKAAEEKGAAAIMKLSDKKEEPKKEQSFDAGKFAGIFAAIGLAIGAIGTAIASVITGFLKLAWWQMPLAIAGLMLIVSGPSIVIAWFKLRQRNLAPILDANGWAVNTKAKINIPFGASLTSMPKLPEGSEKSITDPFAEKALPWKRYIFTLLLIVMLYFLYKYQFLCRI